LLVRVVRARGKHCRSRSAVILRAAVAPALAAFLATALVATGGASASAASALQDPVAPKAAPSVVETYAPYVPQVSCDPTVKPGTDALRSMLLATYGGRDLGITRACDAGVRSEHKEGRAFDWGLSAADPAEKAIADRFLAWLLADGSSGGSGYNARRLGVMYVIWNAKIWSSYFASQGWRAYTGGESHSDHIHISLSWAGAMKRTSWWTGKTAADDYGPCPAAEGEMAAKYAGPRATPCPAPTPVASIPDTPLLQRDSTGPFVEEVQRLLSVTPVSGFFGPVTDAALRAFQTSHRLYVSGKTFGGTWAALRAAAPTAPPAPPVPAPPAPAPPATAASVSPKYLTRLGYTVVKGDTLADIADYWRSSVTALRAANHLRSDTIVPGQVLSVPVKSWLTKFSHRTVRKGNHNATVKALQTAMQMPSKMRTGLFGDLTKGYVNTLKRRNGWAPDGVAGPGVWQKLGG
jgi:peptidoglycan hydrolase-like protein with peptidoglycan-binding domain